jgi:heme oxygenase (biliverdin-producing, ferredoxin)
MTDLEHNRHDRESDVSFSDHGTDRADGGLNHRLICPMGFVSSVLNRADESAERSLSDMLRERTRRLHAMAERSGVFADILQRKVNRSSYALLLRNLLPAYECLEAELSIRRTHPVLGVFANRSLRRSDRLRNDLRNIEGPGWERSVPLLKSGSAYAISIERAAAGDGLRLASHAYVRYFGDLSGGQVLKQLLRKSLSLSADALTVYSFPDTDMKTLKGELRAALDHAGRISDDPHMLVVEAMTAFEHNIGVSREVRDKNSTDVPALV